MADSDKISGHIFIGQTMAEALRKAADFVETCDNPIWDIVPGSLRSGEPSVTIYEEVS